MQRLRALPFVSGPMRSMRDAYGGRKRYFLFRGAEADEAQGGRASLILSIPAQEVPLSPRVGTIHVQAPTPHTPPLQHFLARFSQQASPL